MGRQSSRDDHHIRRGTLLYNVLYTATIAGARALSEAVSALRKEEWAVTPLQEYNRLILHGLVFPVFSVVYRGRLQNNDFLTLYQGVAGQGRESVNIRGNKMLLFSLSRLLAGVSATPQ